MKRTKLQIGGFTTPMILPTPQKFDKSPDSGLENLVEFFDPTGTWSYDDAIRAKSAMNKEGRSIPNTNEAFDLLGALPALGKYSLIKYLRPGNMLSKPAYRYFDWQKAANAVGTYLDEEQRYKENKEKENTTTVPAPQMSLGGYNPDSPDRFNPYNIIPSGDITMEKVPFPILGIDNLGNQQVMQPGMNYKFPGNQVTEIPMKSSYKCGGRMKKNVGGFLEDVGKFAVNMGVTPVEHITGQQFYEPDYNGNAFQEAEKYVSAIQGVGTDIAGSILLGPAYMAGKEGLQMGINMAIPKKEYGGSLKRMYQLGGNLSDYQKDIQKGYQQWQKNPGMVVRLPEALAMDPTNEGNNCINGVCNFLAMSGRPMKSGPWGLDPNVGGVEGSSYTGNVDFMDNAHKEGYYYPSPKEIVEGQGYEIGDIIQFANTKKTAAKRGRFKGEVTDENAMDLWPGHAMIVTGYDPETQNYTLLHNGGNEKYRTSIYSKEKLNNLLTGNHLTGDENADMFEGIMVARYNPDEAVTRYESSGPGFYKKLKEESKAFAPMYAQSKALLPDFASEDYIRILDKQRESVSSAHIIANKHAEKERQHVIDASRKAAEIYQNEFQNLGQVANVPPSTLNEIARYAIGIGNVESLMGQSTRSAIKNATPDKILRYAKKARDKRADDPAWIDMLWKENSTISKDFKEKFPKKDDYKKHIMETYYAEDPYANIRVKEGKRGVLSKGDFQIKQLSGLAKNYGLKTSDLEKNDFRTGYLGTILMAVENYHGLKRKYPELSEDELVYLSVASHSSPKTSKIPEYIDRFGKTKDIDYVNQVMKLSPPIGKQSTLLPEVTVMPQNQRQVRAMGGSFKTKCGCQHKMAMGGTMPDIAAPDMYHAQAGGTHEENPLGGIPVGQNALIEQNETMVSSGNSGSQKDYVFSDRLLIDEATAVKYSLPKNMIGKSFSEAMKLLTKFTS